MGYWGIGVFDGMRLCPAFLLIKVDDGQAHLSDTVK